MSTKYVDIEQVQKRMSSRIRKNNFSKYLFLAATMFGLVVLAVLIVRVLTQGVTYINWDFITGHLSTAPERAGIMGAILGTAWLMLIVIPVTMLIGVGTAIYLELYAKKGKFQSFIATNISNLAGVPSIVYGLLGLTLFVRALEFGNVILAGGLTLSLLVLPIVIVASQEAIRAVPGHLSEASYGMGATKWQTVKKIVLPAALPGILTGSILALSRAIGETAPLIFMGALTYVNYFPDNPLSGFTAIPIQVYNWISYPQAEWLNTSSAGIILLLGLLLSMNTLALFIRNRFEKDW